MRLFDQLEARRSWTPEEKLLLDAVEKLARNEIAPRAADIDQKQEFPWSNIAALNELGMNGIFIPEQYGGSELSFKAYIACVKTLAEACAATAIIYATNFHAIKPLIDFGTEEQKSRLLPVILNGGLASLVITEPSVGSDATHMKTRFTPDGDSIIVEGNKTFITGGDVADLMLVFGKWSEMEDSKKAISALILEKGTEGVTVLRKEDKMGMRGSSTVALSFDGCRVPRANLLKNPGDGLSILFSSLNKSRPSIAAHCLGIARAALQDMVAYMNQRQQFGKKIMEFQGNQFLLADLASEMALCEAWLDYVVDLIDTGAETIDLEASLAKMRCSDLAMRMTTDAVQMHGGYGYIKDNRVERLMRDAKITQIWEGTNQIHRHLIGRSFLQG